MQRENLNFATGLVELSVNGGRTITLNPADAGFAETLYLLYRKLEAVHAEKHKASEAEGDLVKRFDINRAEEAELRDAVDGVFGEGFCADVFPGMRLSAMADGLAVVDNFIFSLLDRMDEDITANLAKREGRIAKYTAKYQKYQKRHK